MNATLATLRSIRSEVRADPTDPGPRYELTVLLAVAPVGHLRSAAVKLAGRTGNRIAPTADKATAAGWLTRWAFAA